MLKSWQNLSRPERNYRLAVLFALVIGVVVRVVKFPALPPGLNADEASSAYEAFSLATTGADRWGNHLPAYFPGWGSGQNVLLSYLTVPVVQVLGLNMVSVRLVPLLLGLLTLPLFFVFLRPLGRRPALLGLLLLALAPWHFMLSRWGLESNLVVFWMLLGCFMLVRAIATQRRRWIVPALLPFAVALYAYGTTIIVLPTLFLLVLVGCWRRIVPRLGAWLLAVGLFGLAAAPFLLFFFENYVLHRNLAWTDHLFFATPLLVGNRLEEVSQHGTWHDFYNWNTDLLMRGFDDKTVYNLLTEYPLLAHFVWGLALLGFLVLVVRLWRVGRQLAAQPALVVGLLTVAWLLACAPLFYLFELNINRVNHFFMPCLVLAVWGTTAIINNLRPDAPKRLIWKLVLLWVVLDGFPAVRYYFRSYRHGAITTDFRAGLAPAFAALAQLPATGQVLIDLKTDPAYIYVLYHLRYPPARFQHEAQVTVVKGSYQVHKFGRYVLNKQLLTTGRTYNYVSRLDSLPADAQHRKTIVYHDDQWEVGTMQVGAPARE
jgi:4-amino-4-deoxy-L-arabinose transferase-like glycosyltransferase